MPKSMMITPTPAASKPVRASQEEQQAASSSFTAALCAGSKDHNHTLQA